MGDLILGSSSPRRQAILQQVEQPFTIRKPDIDESVITTPNPVEKVEQLATIKGRHIPIENEQEIILSADTVVGFDHQIFEKPNTRDDAYQMMKQLSGQSHAVFTGGMLRSANQEDLFVERTEVEFWPLSEEEILWYIDTDEPYDKAGAYGIQSIGARFVKQIHGDYYNVMGLPISQVIRRLQAFNI
ncbi:Maf family protein [Alkalibacillus almallahensis]|uniref:Maf family protein n=1 Tax=Alkalibacillus almallahensis TaxID=1379154 RepID=UPI00141F9A12|nr:Maf family protein [Alkalibacillus almallahensis]NIK13113.1 septum formation protein [Alkalibacillus almallahensis]